jgi:transposase
VRVVRVWARLLGVERTVVEDVCFDEDALVVAVRPVRRERSRCGICRRRCRGYDQG